MKRQVNEPRRGCEQPVIPVRTRKLVGEDEAKRGRACFGLLTPEKNRRGGESRWHKVWPRMETHAALFEAVEDFFGGHSSAVAVPMRIVQKIEIFIAIEKLFCVASEAAF